MLMCIILCIFQCWHKKQSMLVQYALTWYFGKGGAFPLAFWRGGPPFGEATHNPARSIIPGEPRVSSPIGLSWRPKAGCAKSLRKDGDGRHGTTMTKAVTPRTR